MKPRAWAWPAAYAVLIMLTVFRVASTHRVFSEVLDEPVHVAAGLEWWRAGTFESDPSHPPLEWILSALPLRLAGIRLPAERNAVQRGNWILYGNGRYEDTLSMARMGNLVLLILLIAGTAWWARRWLLEPVPFIAAALLSSVPPVLGHAGVATTDLAVAAAIPFALFALDRWLDLPDGARSCFLGFATGIGLLSKFSFLLFFPVAAAIVIVLRKRSMPARSLAIAAAVAFFVVWAGYRFSFAPLSSSERGEFLTEVAPRVVQPAVAWITKNVPIPAPDFPIGAAVVKLHDRGGHRTYLLGRYSETGWWYYFPVIFFYKTPIPFLILVAWGIGVLWIVARRSGGEIIPMTAVLQFALVPLVILLSAMTSRINIGVRHILPVYPGLAIAAAVAVVTIWRESRHMFSRAAIAALTGWLVIGTAVAHPDYLAWFNEAAGEHPERIAVDSNLDWGQDLIRLGRAARELHIRRMTTIVATNAWLGRHYIPSGPEVEPYRKQTGWIAISETVRVLLGSDGQYSWLEDYQPRRIGKSIRLYYVPTGDPDDVGPGAIARSETEQILLPIAGTITVQGAPGGARWRVDQSVRNNGTRRAHVSLSQCAAGIPCVFDLQPGQSARIAGSDPIRPFIVVTVPGAIADSLAFSTVAQRVDAKIPGSEIVVPAVRQSELRNGVVTIENVQFSATTRLNLRLYVKSGSASAAKVRVSESGRAVAERIVPIYYTGYYVNGDFASLFPELAGRDVRATVTIAAGTRVWAFLTATDAVGRSTVYLPSDTRDSGAAAREAHTARSRRP